MDHPFDDLAVKAAERAIEQTVGMDWPSKDCAQAALTAACNSMKERGKATDGTSLKSGWGTGIFLAMYEFPKGTVVEEVPVTIFRHGE